MSRRRRRDEVRWWLIFNICDFGWSWTRTWAALRGINVTSVFMCSRVESLKTGGSLQCSLVVLIQGSPILGYSDGVHPKQHRVFVVTAQELDVVRLFLDVGMLQHEAEVGGSSVFLLVVVGGVDVDFFKMDKAGEIAGSLSDRQKNKSQEIMFVYLESFIHKTWYLNFWHFNSFTVIFRR